MNTRFTQGDLWGGLAASAVILPQATAFGIALWTPYSTDPASAALAGLITTIALCLFSGLSSGTRGMVSSPTGPTMVLVSGALVSLSANGFQGVELISNIAVLLFISGVLQILIGLSNGGRLIKYIPYPVVAGFMTGSAILMVMSQVKMLELSHFEHVFASGLWIPWVTALVTLLSILMMPRLLPGIPGTVSGLVIGVAVFHSLFFITPFEYQASWVVGRLPDLTSLQLVLPDSLNTIPWSIILPVSIALAVLSSLDSLLTSMVTDVATGERHNAKRELTGQGIGQSMAALFGGIAGAGTTGASLVAIKSGGRHWVAVVSAVGFFMIILLMGPVASLLPISVLAGIILHVAIAGMLERDIFAWLKRRKNRLDAATALLVTSVTVAYDLMIAVAVGLLFATFQFVRAQIKAPVIHRRSNISQHPSLKQRSENERSFLELHADDIIIYELKGNLFFGTTDRLFEEVSAELDKPISIIFDMGRIQQVDLSAVRMLQQMATRLTQANGELIFTNVRSGKGLSRKVDKTLRKISPHHRGKYPVKTFIDADEAIEYAENKLLEKIGKQASEFERVELEHNHLFHDCDQQTITNLQQIMTPVSVKSGKFLFKTNDPGSELYIVVEGEIDILLPIGEHHYKRLRKFGPGSFFGEIVFLKPGLRTADAKAMRDTELLMLDKQGFEQLNQQHPDTAIKLLMRLGRELSDRLRWSDRELRRLAE